MMYLLYAAGVYLGACYLFGVYLLIRLAYRGKLKVLCLRLINIAIPRWRFRDKRIDPLLARHDGLTVAR